MVSLTEQVRVMAVVEELTTTPNIGSAAGATEDSISTSREPAGTGRGGEEGDEKRGKEGESVVHKNQYVSLVPQTYSTTAYWSLSLFPSPPEALHCLSFHCRCRQLLASHQSPEEWSD